jgi:drug/metabolite transporter (DMT)-like permease
MLMWNLLHPPLEAFMHEYSSVQWGWIFFIGTLGTIIPFGLYFQGIKRIRPAHASITAILEPISASVIAAVFLGELMTLPQILGGLLVIVSIGMLQLDKTKN